MTTVYDFNNPLNFRITNNRLYVTGLSGRLQNNYSSKARASLSEVGCGNSSEYRTMNYTEISPFWVQGGKIWYQFDNGSSVDTWPLSYILTTGYNDKTNPLVAITLINGNLEFYVPSDINNISTANLKQMNAINKTNISTRSYITSARSNINSGYLATYNKAIESYNNVKTSIAAVRTNI